ncbi:MAG: PAS domain-containing protein, partial [Rubrivivax sp.]|nr:PAS domain-containing protein [Rubrivivax sp.]
MTPLLTNAVTAVTAASQADAAWALLIDALPQPTWVVELGTLTVVAANPAATTLLGLAPRALLGQAAAEVLQTPEDRAYWADVAAGTTEPLSSDATLCTADGRNLHVTRSIRPLCGADRAAPKHCAVTLVDRSAARRAEEGHEDTVAE